MADRIGTATSWMRFEYGDLKDCGDPRFAIESVSDCARNGTEGSRCLFLFLIDAVLLCMEMCCDTFCIATGAKSDVF